MTRTLVMVAAGLLAAGGTAGWATSQAHAVQAASMHKASSAPMSAGWHHHQAFRVGLRDVAAALKLSPAALKKDVRSGDSLSSLANRAGISTQTLEATLTQDAQTALNQAVKSGRMTQTQASLWESRLSQHIGAWVTASHPFKRPDHAMPRTLLTDAASALHLTRSTLVHDLRSGQSLADLAGSSSATASLENTLKADVDQMVQAKVKAGQLTEAQAAARENNLPKRIDAWVTGSGGHRAMAFRPHRMLKRGLLRDAAAALNVSPQTLVTDLRSGKTLADVAGNAAAVTNLEHTLSQDIAQKLTGAVQSGQLTQAQSSRIESRLTTVVDRFVTQGRSR